MNILNQKKNIFLKIFTNFYSPSIHNLINLQLNRLHLTFPRNFNDPFDSFICKEDEQFIKYAILKNIKKNKLIGEDSFTEVELKILEYSPIKGKYREELGHSDDFETMLFNLKIKKNADVSNKINEYNYDVRRKCRDLMESIRNIPFHITCFSVFDGMEELGKNLTMWSHYADSHKGFCVKYSTNFENNDHKNLINCGFLPVIYTSRVPTITFKDFKILLDLRNDFMTNSSILKKIYKSLITKSSFWNYEKNGV